MSESHPSLLVCPVCKQLHRRPNATAQRWQCVRCRAVWGGRLTSRVRAGITAACALSAFILFWPGILLPVLLVEKLGYHSESSILAGTIRLIQNGDWLIGGVILLFSIVFPLIKMALLVELSLFGLLRRRAKIAAWRFIHFVGRWSMLDVLLVAFLVMLVRLGDLVRFEPGPAVLAFCLSVVLSMLASWLFDPEIIWESRR